MTTRILSIETATPEGSFALNINGEIISRSVNIPQKHTEFALPFIHELLSTAGISLSQLDAIAVGRGPGSFTGVRLAISLGQALAYGADCPGITISTLRTLAFGAKESAQKIGATTILAALDARMGEVYWCAYTIERENLKPIAEESVIHPSLVEGPEGVVGDNVVAIGTGWKKEYQEAMVEALGVTPRIMLPTALPHAKDLAKLAELELAAGNTVSYAEILPTYCRDKVVF